MKVVLIGSTGQLGREIIKNSPENINLIIPSRFQLDLSKPEECYEYIMNMAPEWIINSGAYTNVDKAEKYRTTAFKVNALGPKSIAKALSKYGGKLLHISTDYVFDGSKNLPYKVNHNISPVNFYGVSKSKGEEYIQKLLPNHNQLCIIRTSWLMGPFGNNFATKIIKLLGERDEIKVVYDQIASPTTTLSLARAIWESIRINNEYSLKKKSFPKINHFTNSGIASWYDVAIALREIGLKKGLIKRAGNILPIESNDYPLTAHRPNFSVLDSKGTKEILHLKDLHWRYELFRAFDILYSDETHKTDI